MAAFAGLLGERNAAAGDHPCVERARHGQSGGRDDAARARDGRDRTCGRRAGGGTRRWTCRRSDATSRLSGHGSSTAQPASARSRPRRVCCATCPWQGGGDMIRTVAFDNTTFAPPPQRFEAGTPNIAGAIALAAAIDYVQGVGPRASTSTSRPCSTTARARSPPSPGYAWSAPRSAKPASCPSWSTASTSARPSAPSSTPRVWRSAPGTTARCR